VREEIKLKGSVLWGVINALEKGAGAEPRAAILKDLDGDLGEGVNTRSIIATGWYPIAWHRQLLGCVMRHGGPTALRDTVKLSTRENVSTIHRILVRMISPETLLKQGTRLFSSFFEAQAVTTQDKPGYSKIEWIGCRGFDKNVWLAQTQSVEELVAMAGAKVKRRTVLSGGTDLDDGMVLELVYST